MYDRRETVLPKLHNIFFMSSFPEDVFLLSQNMMH